VHIENHKSEWL